MVSALAVGGTFWDGFADVLSHAAVPTNSAEFGKALAAAGLVLVPQLVQYLVGRMTRKRTGRRIEDLLNQIVAKHLAGHQL
jgi:uncharacterized membrane protein YjfL (UPF0719 family)